VTDLITESQMLKALRHPNILQFLGFISDAEAFGIVTEFMELGSLYDILKKVRNNKSPPIEDQIKMKILSDIARGMHYLHSHEPKILHRDLKSMNVLVSSSYQAKLADMGLSRIVTRRGSMSMSIVGTPHWAAPEIVNKLKYSEKADIWSYGVIVWETVTHQRPYAGLKRQEVISRGRKGLSPVIPLNCPPFFKELMGSCFQNASFRPSFQIILKDITLELNLQQNNNGSTAVLPNTTMIDQLYEPISSLPAPGKDVELESPARY